ncbi:hypothetical protein ACFV0T_39025 [Streptomyces sp. NPDC059582]|uniref:hypothetical protein n=1 Tax=Streptomyces sp. NPDC059582 TaxID=3346875 RepID=UPI0036C3A6DF
MAALVVVAVTRWPRVTGRGTSRRPRTPVAPAPNTRTPVAPAPNTRMSITVPIPKSVSET